MDDRQLTCFLTLAEELHFGRAAERLHMSQPPLSRMIQQLEQQLGISLFERTKRKVLLTAAGETLVHDARQMIIQLDTIKKRFRYLKQGQTGILKIGYVGATMHSQLPTLLSSFAKKFPAVQFQFEELPNHSLLHGLNHGSLDIAFVRTWLHPDNLSEKLITTESFAAILPNHHSLANKKKISIKELKDEKFIVFLRECGPTIFDQFLSICSKAGFTPNIIHHASQLNSILRLVESGFGIALLPQNIQNGYQLKLKYVPLINSNETIPLIMLNRKENTNPLVTYLQQHLLKKVNSRF
jgi:DNA-binding transcriptional LysR family regulator